MAAVTQEMQRIHAALRRSRSLSTWGGAEPELESERRIQAIRGHLARARALLEAGKTSAVADAMADLLTLDPDCAEAHEMLWRAGGYGIEDPKA